MLIKHRRKVVNRTVALEHQRFRNISLNLSRLNWAWTRWVFAWGAGIQRSSIESSPTMRGFIALKNSNGASGSFCCNKVLFIRTISNTIWKQERTKLFVRSARMKVAGLLLDKFSFTRVLLCESYADWKVLFFLEIKSRTYCEPFSFSAKPMK